MKKILVLGTMFLVAICANAQFMRAEELEKYSKEKYGDKWVEAAQNLKSQLTLDKNNSLTYSQVIDCGEKTKDELYIILNLWFTMSFNDANSVIKLNDKQAGTIIGQGFVESIASHVGGITAYDISIKPIIKVDIKDKKIRVTYTIQYYDATLVKGGGFLGSRNSATQVEEKWPIEQCFPFVDKDKHKKTSSKALVMSHAYSNVIMDKIEEAVKNGVTGNETNDW